MPFYKKNNKKDQLEKLLKPKIKESKEVRLN